MSHSDINSVFLSPEQAAARLGAGGLVALPTETVYGLAADADNAHAIAQVYATKGRPADHPLIVHVAGIEQAHIFGIFDALNGNAATNVAHNNLGPNGAFSHSGMAGQNGRDGSIAPSVAPAAARFIGALMRAFWPGPLTLIVPRRSDHGQAAASGQDSIGLRCPDHAVAQAVLRACLALEKPVWGLAAPSANRFGRISPTTAEHVLEDFAGRVPVVDGGACAVGVESTIVDCTRDVLVILRPGAIGAAEIAKATGQWPLTAAQAAQRIAQAAPRASGTLAAHYAPRARLVLFETQQELAQIVRDARGRVALYARAAMIAAAQAHHLDSMPSNANNTAQTPKPRVQKTAFCAEVAPVAQDWILLPQPEDDAQAAAALFADLRHLDAAAPALIAVQRRGSSSADNALNLAIADRLNRAAAAALADNTHQPQANALT